MVSPAVNFDKSHGPLRILASMAVYNNEYSKEHLRGSRTYNMGGTADTLRLTFSGFDDPYWGVHTSQDTVCDK